MGVNAFFTYTVILKMGYSWQAGLAAVFISGIIFLLISISGMRKKLITAIPKSLKIAIGAGIGFFIAFIGLANANIIIAVSSTGVELGNLADPSVLLALFGIVVTLFLIAKKVPAAVFIGMLITAIVGIIIGSTLSIDGMPSLPSSYFQSDFNMVTFGSFMDGISELFSKPFSCLIVLFSFVFVDFFETVGTLVAVSGRANLINEKGELENGERALVADSVGTIFGAVLGTSTITTFVESSAGIEAGGRTGLCACVTGVLFLLSIFISPVVLACATSAVTAPALVAVGILMAQQLGKIDWEDFAFATSSFLTVIMMLLTYSIANGIAFGFISYSLIMLAMKRYNDISIIIWICDIIFILYFLSLTLL